MSSHATSGGGEQPELRRHVDQEGIRALRRDSPEGSAQPGSEIGVRHDSENSGVLRKLEDQAPSCVQTLSARGEKAEGLAMRDPCQREKDRVVNARSVSA